MSTSVMIMGSIFREAAEKTSKSGKGYVVATIKAGAGTGSEFWTALAFGSTETAELMRLAEGEKVAVQGTMKIEAKIGADGSIKVYRTVFVDVVLALKPRPKEAKPKAAKPARAAPKSAAETRAPLFDRRERDFDDTIPF